MSVAMPIVHGRVSGFFIYPPLHVARERQEMPEHPRVCTSQVIRFLEIWGRVPRTATFVAGLRNS